MTDYGTNRAVLSWATTDAEYVTVSPGIGYAPGGVPSERLPASGSWAVYPDTVGVHTYTFTAHSRGLTRTASATVTVNYCVPYPVITSFGHRFEDGPDATFDYDVLVLTWTTLHTVTTELYELIDSEWVKIGDFEPNDETEFQLSFSTAEYERTFRLVAKNIDGDSVEEEQVVHIGISGASRDFFLLRFEEGDVYEKERELAAGGWLTDHWIDNKYIYVVNAGTDKIEYSIPKILDPAATCRDMMLYKGPYNCWIRHPVPDEEEHRVVALYQDTTINITAHFLFRDLINKWHIVLPMQMEAGIAISEPVLAEPTEPTEYPEWYTDVNPWRATDWLYITTWFDTSVPFQVETLGGSSHPDFAYVQFEIENGARVKIEMNDHREHVRLDDRDIIISTRYPT